MSTQIRTPEHKFRSYCKDNSLLIQFMIVEFVHTAQLTAKLSVLSEEYFSAKKPSLSGLPHLKQGVAQLLCNYPQQNSSSHSRWTKGPLTKLKEYCQIFSCNSSHQNKPQINLHMAAHQALLNTVHLHELLNSLTVNPSIPNSGTLLNLLPIRRTFDTFQARMNQVIRYFPSVLHPFWTNENVLLCLLRKRSWFLDIYGPDFFDKRFKCPVKAKELYQFLTQRFQERGYDSLIPMIQLYCDSERA